MHVTYLSLRDFRSYETVELSLGPGATTFVGPNGEGKTNLLEALAYVATLGSPRAAQDAPLVRAGAERAVLRANVRHDGRDTLVEIEINPRRANRARLNRTPVSRLREVLGVLRVVLFSPDDLSLIKGDPAERRRFLDETLVAHTPRHAAARADYERVLKQRNALLKSAAGVARNPRGRQGRARGGAGGGAGGGDHAEDAEDPAGDRAGDVGHTLDIWDAHLARAGAELVAARLELLRALRPLVRQAYESLARSDARVELSYASSLDTADEPAPDRAALESALLKKLASSRAAELERGVSLAGPHRDELAVSLGELSARGYASHGESWSLALALRLAAYELLRGEGIAPVLLLDDVFAELDSVRRDRLAALVTSAEQVLITGAYAGDIPDAVAGTWMDVRSGEVREVTSW